jgi:Ca-activated chloride channel family protein
MLTLAYPWLLALLPLPAAVWLAVPPYRQSRQSVRAPFLARLASLTGQQPAPGAIVMRGGWLRWLALWALWSTALLAVARPQFIEPPVSKTVPVRDLLLAVDLSGSMEVKDFHNAAGAVVDRLTAVKQVLDDFLARRQGDRVGLIFFGSAPFVQAPFTDDLKLCRKLLDEAQTNLAGPQTALGDAIGLAITMFDRSDLKDRVLIVLTDGNDTASKVPPKKAAEIAKTKGIVIHTVAVGDPQAAGEDALDTATLQDIATSTGGLYSFAADRDQLAEIYRQLDQLGTRPAETITHRPRRDLYWVPLAVTLVGTLAYHALRLTFSRLGHGRAAALDRSAPAALGNQQRSAA